MKVILELSEKEAANLMEADVREEVRKKVRAAVALTATPDREIEALKVAVIAVSPFLEMDAGEIADFLHRQGVRV